MMEHLQFLEVETHNRTFGCCRPFRSWACNLWGTIVGESPLPTIIGWRCSIAVRHRTSCNQPLQRLRWYLPWRRAWTRSPRVEQWSRSCNWILIMTSGWSQFEWMGWKIKSALGWVIGLMNWWIDGLPWLVVAKWDLTQLSRSLNTAQWGVSTACHKSQQVRPRSSRCLPLVQEHRLAPVVCCVLSLVSRRWQGMVGSEGQRLCWFPDWTIWLFSGNAIIECQTHSWFQEVWYHGNLIGERHSVQTEVSIFPIS